MNKQIRETLNFITLGFALYAIGFIYVVWENSRGILDLLALICGIVGIVIAANELKNQNIYLADIVGNIKNARLPIGLNIVSMIFICGFAAFSWLTYTSVCSVCITTVIIAMCIRDRKIKGAKSEFISRDIKFISAFIMFYIISGAISLLDVRIIVVITTPLLALYGALLIIYDIMSIVDEELKE